VTGCCCISVREICNEVSFSFGCTVSFLSCSPLTSSDTCLTAVYPADVSVVSQRLDRRSVRDQVEDTSFEKHHISVQICEWQRFSLHDWSCSDAAVTDLLRLLGWDTDVLLHCNLHRNFSCLVYCISA